jgi:hypothetical protein
MGGRPKRLGRLAVAIAIAAIAMGLSASTALAAPTLSGSATPTAPLGGSLTDAAILSGASPLGVGGTMIFDAYGPNDPTCVAPAAFHNTVDADQNGTYYPSVPFTPTATGTYTWKLTWAGSDVDPGGASRPCDPLDAGQTSIVTPAALPPATSPPTAPCAGLTRGAAKRCACKQKKGKRRKKCLRRLRGRRS